MANKAYKIKQISHDQHIMISGLFNQYRIFYNQPSNVELSKDFIAERLFNNESVIFMAVTGDFDLPVGFVQLYKLFSSINASKSTILNDLFVSPEYRNKGIGKQLVETAIKYAKNAQSEFIELETSRNNLIAKRLYELLGFTEAKITGDFDRYHKFLTY